MKIQWSYLTDEYRLPDFISGELLRDSHAIKNWGLTCRHIDERGGMRVFMLLDRWMSSGSIINTEGWEFFSLDFNNNG